MAHKQETKYGSNSATPEHKVASDLHKKAAKSYARLIGKLGDERYDTEEDIENLNNILSRMSHAHNVLHQYHKSKAEE